MGGTDDKENLVLLTAREHFLAHVLLHKIYPDNVGLLCAAKNFRCRNKRLRRTFKVNSRIYDALKKDWHNFITNSKWVYNLKTFKRHRMWNDIPTPDGFADGMGPSSIAFKTAMNNRAKEQNPIIIDGITYSIKDISEKYNIPRDQILSRIRNGWSAEEIISTPYIKIDHTYTESDIQELYNLFEEWKTVKTSELISNHPNIFNGKHGVITGIRIVTLFRKYISEYDEYLNTPGHIHSVYKLKYNGKVQSISDWARDAGISHNTFSRRLASGWSIEDALTKPVAKPGLNFADTAIDIQDKKKLAEQMLTVFKEAGYGILGIKLFAKSLILI